MLPPTRFNKTRGLNSLGWLLLCFCVLAGATILYWRLHPMSTPAPVGQTPAPVLTVTAAAPAVLSLEKTVRSTGSVAAKDLMEIASESSGLSIRSLEVEEGDYVQAGQVLAVLDSSVLEAQLEQARARYASGLQQVAKAARPFRSQDIERAQAAYLQAVAAAAQEKATLLQAQASQSGADQTSQRYQSVLLEGFVTRQEASERANNAEQARALVTAARQRYQAAVHSAEQARQQLNLTRAAGRPEDVGIAQATTRETAGQIHQLQAQLRQTLLRAPDAGWVVSRSARLGQVTSSDKVLFAIARHKELEIRAEVPQDDLLQLRVGMPATVHFGDLATRGTVWQISPQVNHQTRLGVARILLAPGSLLKPGMLAEVVVRVGSRQVPTVPASSVLGGQPDYYAYRLIERIGNRARVERREIKIGMRTDQLVELRKGIQLSDQVVVIGASQLEDQDIVEVAP